MYENQHAKGADGLSAIARKRIQYAREMERLRQTYGEMANTTWELSLIANLADRLEMDASVAPQTCTHCRHWAYHNSHSDGSWGICKRLSTGKKSQGILRLAATPPDSTATSESSEQRIVTNETFFCSEFEPTS